MARLRPDTWLDLSDRLDGMQLHDLSIGYDGCVYLLASSQHIKKHDGRSPILHTDEPYDCTVFKIDDQKQISTYHIPQQTMTYHFVQPLPYNRLILACARAKYYNAHQYDRNARIFSSDGRLQQAFNIGYGLRHLQTTSTGTIWTGYSDVGKLWLDGEEKSLPGVVQWNQTGELLSIFDGAIRNPVFDCYALNLEDDVTTWLCYYPDFPLVRLKDGEVDATWRNVLSSVRAVAVSDDYVVLYRGKTELRVYRFEDTLLQPENQIQHKMTRPHWLTARGDTFVFLYNRELHRLTVQDIVTA